MPLSRPREPDNPWYDVRQLCVDWAPELGFRDRGLAAEIVGDLLNGRLEEYPHPHTQIVVDRRAYDLGEGQLATKFAEISAITGSQSAAFEALVSGDEIGLRVHEGIVRTFAARRRLQSPSWWADPPKPSRSGRPVGTGFDAFDRPLVAEMIQDVATGKFASLTKAADGMVKAGRVEGGGTPQSKIDRLVRLAKAISRE